MAQGAIPGISEHFGNLAALVLLVPVLSQLPKKWFNIKSPAWMQLTSWLISIALCFFGWIFGLGLFADIEVWWQVLLYGFAVGLASNGIFDIEIVRLALNAIFSIKK